MNKILVFGAGGHAQVVLDCIESMGVFQVEGFIAESSSSARALYPYKFLGNEKDNIERIVKTARGVIAIGDNYLRSKVQKEIRNLCPTFKFTTIVHARAYVARSAKLGSGTVVMPGAVVNAGTDIGQHCIINTSASIDHDCSIADFCAIMPGATTGGGVKVKNSSSLCLGSKVIHGISIGENCVIGAGAVVVEDVPDNAMVLGIPAKVHRFRKAGESFL